MKDFDRQADFAKGTHEKAGSIKFSTCDETERRNKKGNNSCCKLLKLLKGWFGTWDKSEFTVKSI